MLYHYHRKTGDAEWTYKEEIVMVRTIQVREHREAPRRATYPLNNIIAKTKDVILMSSRDHPKNRHDLHQNINGH